MSEPSDGETAIFLQLLIKLRSIRVSEATSLLSALRHRAPGLPPSLEEFLAKCNRRIASSGMQIHTGFDGEASSLVLRSTTAGELLPRGDQLQRILNRLQLLSEAEAACTAAILENIVKTRAAVPLPDFVRLCVTHRVPSAPKLLRSLLELRWLAAESPASQPDKRQLILGPCFYLILMQYFEGDGLRACAVCKQPAILKLERCNSCGVECHVSCIEELRGKVQSQEDARLTCCSCNASWNPAHGKPDGTETATS